MIEHLPNGHLVDWGRGELRPAPRRNRPRRNETRFPVTCPFCLRTRWLSKTDANRATRCKFCSASENGKKGFRAALHASAAWRRTNRSWAEGVIAAWLDEMNIQYESEKIVEAEGRVYAIDFVIDRVLFVEVNGWGHKLEERRERDERLMRVGIPTVFLTTDELRENPVEARTKLHRAIVQSIHLEAHHEPMSTVALLRRDVPKPDPIAGQGL